MATLYFQPGVDKTWSQNQKRENKLTSVLPPSPFFIPLSQCGLRGPVGLSVFLHNSLLEVQHTSEVRAWLGEDFDVMQTDSKEDVICTTQG